MCSKGLLRESIGLHHVSLTRAVKRAISKGLISERDYVFGTGRGKAYFYCTQGFLNGLAAVVNKAKLPILYSEETQKTEIIAPRDYEPAVPEIEKTSCFDPRKARQIRLNLGLSQSKAGKEIRIIQPQVSRFELGGEVHPDSIPGRKYLEWLKSKGYNPFGI